MKSPRRSALLAEIAELQMRLEGAEETLRAIRGGEVDALLIEGASGPQVYTLQGQDADASRIRSEMLAQVNDAVIAVDGEMRVTYLNAAAERLYGVTASLRLGKLLSSLYQCQWPDPEDETAGRAVLRECGEWRGEVVHVKNDGRSLNVESSVTVLRDISGQPTGLLAVIRDVTKRKQHEEQVRISEIRYRRLFEAAHDGVLILDPNTCKIVDANPFMTLLLGYKQEQLIGKELFEIGLLKDEFESQEMIRELNRCNQVRYDHMPLRSQEGRLQDVEVVANIYDENGRRVIQCNIRDITERRRAEERVRLLMAEVNHRARNLLAVVQAVSQQTVKYGDPGTFAARLSDRINGLAVGQDLLVRNFWKGVEVADLVEVQLAHFRDLFGTRILLEGPRALLTTAAAQGIGMALHELSTNAAKYGALSNSSGIVRVKWQATAGIKPEFSMFWRENGGPKVEMPTRSGFGKIVIGRMAEAAVEGIVEIEFREEGLSWKLSAPIENALAVSESAAIAPNSDAR